MLRNTFSIHFPNSQCHWQQRSRYQLFFKLQLKSNYGISFYYFPIHLMLNLPKGYKHNTTQQAKVHNDAHNKPRAASKYFLFNYIITWVYVTKLLHNFIYN